MAIPEESWRHCFVAFYDILGIRYALAADPEAAVATIAKLLLNADESAAVMITAPPSGNLIRDRIGRASFSDSLLLFTHSDTDDDLYALMATSAILVAHSFGYGVPLRGGIAEGLMCIDYWNKIFTGPALVEAYTISETKDWLGVAVQEAVAGRAEPLDLGTHDGGDLIVPWNIPAKKGHTSGYALNWPGVVASDIGERPVTPERLCRFFLLGSAPFSQLPSHAREKYVNAAAFFNAMCPS